MRTTLLKLSSYQTLQKLKWRGEDAKRIKAELKKMAGVK